MNFRSTFSHFFAKDLLFVFSIFLILGLAASFIIPLLTILTFNFGLFSFKLINLTFYFDFATIEALFIAVATISLIFWGYAIDKYDRKIFLLIGLILTILGLFLILVFNNIVFYIIGRVFFMGFGLGALGPVAYSYAGDIIKYDKRSSISGSISVIGIISSGLGILFSVFIFKLTNNILTPFFLILVIVLIFFILSIGYSDPLRGKEEPEIKEVILNQNKLKDLKQLETEYSQKITITSILNLFKRKTNVLMFLQGIFALISSVIFTYFLISFFSDTKNGGLSFPIEYALLLAMGPSTGRIFGYLFLGYIGDYFHNKQGKWYTGKGKVLVAGVSMLLQGPAMMLAFIFVLPPYDSSVTFIDNIFQIEYIIFGLLFFLGAFIGGGSGPNRRSITYDINEPELRGQASSIFSIGDSIGASLGLFLGSSLIRYSNYNVAFQIISIGYIIAGLFWLLALSTIKEDEKDLRQIIQTRVAKF